MDSSGRLRVAALVAVVLAACVKGNTTTSTNGASPSRATGGGSGKIGSTKISGVGRVLHNPQGFTLYHLITEKNGQFQCTGSCTSTWRPYLAPGGRAPSSAASLPEQVGTITRPDGGVQVTYDGFPLYTYSGDSGPGQANGNGRSKLWYAVTPTGDASSSGSGAASRSGYVGGSYG